MAIIAFNIFLMLALIPVYLFISSEMNSVISAVLVAIVASSLILFFSRRENEVRLKGQFLRHSNLVLVGYIIVHFQHYIDYILGRFSEGNSAIWVNNQVVMKSMVLSSIALIAFLIGYLIFSGKIKNGTTHNANEKVSKLFFLKLCALASVLAYLGTVNPLYVAGGYGLVDMGASATYAAFAFDILIFSIIIQESRNAALSGDTNISFGQYIKLMGVLVPGMLAAYLLTVLLSGDRGTLITHGLCYFSGYLFITKKKIGWIKGVMIVFAAATVITILGVARTISDTSSFNQKVYMALQKEENGSEVSFIPQTQELASSVKTLHYVVDFVPEHHDFLYGRFQFQQIINVLPFASVFYPVIFDDVSQKYAGSGSFITWIVQGEYPTYGNGSSVVADFYLAFGLLGVIAGMFVFGGVMRFSEMKMYGSNPPGLFWNVFLIVYFCNAIYISRSSFLEGFKFVVWVYIALVINKYLFNRNVHA